MGTPPGGVWPGVGAGVSYGHGFPCGVSWGIGVGEGVSRGVGRASGVGVGVKLWGGSVVADGMVFEVRGGGTGFSG